MRRKKRVLRFLIILSLLVALLWSLYDSNSRISVSRYTLRLQTLPAAFEGLRIAHLSDIHANRFGEGDDRLLETLRALDPHLIAITGDLTDANGQIPRVTQLCAELTAIAPVYYVSGNHEWGTDEAYALFDALEQAGVTVLRNEYVTLTAGQARLVLAGVDDVNGPYDMKTPEQLMEEIRAAEGDACTILLAHRPEFFDQYAALGFDLVLSGHIHGGMVRLPLLGGLLALGRDFFPEYDLGQFTSGGSTLIVSGGLSGVGAFPRVFNPYDLPLITLTAS